MFIRPADTRHSSAKRAHLSPKKDPPKTSLTLRHLSPTSPTIYIYIYTLDKYSSNVRVEEVKASIGRVLIASPHTVHLTCRSDGEPEALETRDHESKLVRFALNPGIPATRHVNTKLIPSIRRCDGVLEGGRPRMFRIWTSAWRRRKIGRERRREMGSTSVNGEPRWHAPVFVFQR